MSSAEQMIIEATIRCIEKYGIDKTTIRQIGMEAGMNSASISYYFRSKYVLMERVMEVVLFNAFDIGNFDNTRDLPYKERLARVMEGMIAGAYMYPNITKYFFLELLRSNNYDSPMVQKCNAFIKQLQDEMEEAYPDIPEDDIGMVLMQISSATFLFPGLFPGFFTGFPHIDLSDEAIRRVYVEKLISGLIK